MNWGTMLYLFYIILLNYIYYIFIHYYLVLQNKSTQQISSFPIFTLEK